MKDTWDDLNILTKEEIIVYLKQNNYDPPYAGKVAFFKWEIRNEELGKEMSEFLNDDTGKELAKEHDRLAVIFNKEKDTDKRIKLMEKLIKIKEKLKAHHERWHAIQKQIILNNGEFEKNRAIAEGKNT